VNCIQCGEKLISKMGTHQFDDEYTGSVSVDLKNSMKCGHCGEILLSWGDADRVEKAEVAALEEALQSRPVKDFITEKETAKILGKSKQAVSKHRRIRRGFIFQTRFDGRKMYLRESVELYKLTKDGRFQLIEKLTDLPRVVIQPPASKQPPFIIDMSQPIPSVIKTSSIIKASIPAGTGASTRILRYAQKN